MSSKRVGGHWMSEWEMGEVHALGPVVVEVWQIVTCGSSTSSVILGATSGWLRCMKGLIELVFSKDNIMG